MATGRVQQNVITRSVPCVAVRLVGVLSTTGLVQWLYGETRGQGQVVWPSWGWRMYSGLLPQHVSMSDRSMSGDVPALA